MEKIKSEIPENLMTKDFYICAPPVMIMSLADQLVENGIPSKNIHFEEFNF